MVAVGRIGIYLGAQAIARQKSEVRKLDVQPFVMSLQPNEHIMNGYSLYISIRSKGSFSAEIERQA